MSSPFAGLSRDFPGSEGTDFFVIIVHKTFACLSRSEGTNFLSSPFAGLSRVFLVTEGTDFFVFTVHGTFPGVKVLSFIVVTVRRSFAGLSPE